MSFDLVWDDYREEDMVHSLLSGYKMRVKKASRVVYEWLGLCDRPYVACSGGKDSVAMLHLVQTAAMAIGLQRLPVMWHDSGVEFPGTKEVFGKLREIGLIDRLVVVHSTEDVLGLKRKQECGKISAGLKDELALFAPIRRCIAEERFDGVTLGLRAGESSGRAAGRAAHGLIHQTLDGLQRCSPIGDWSWRDVFAYIAANQLPLHPIYSAPLYHLENRGRIRLSWWASTDNHRHGELAWMKLVFPGLYTRMVAEIPEARRLPS